MLTGLVGSYCVYLEAISPSFKFTYKILEPIFSFFLPSSQVTHRIIVYILLVSTNLTSKGESWLLNCWWYEKPSESYIEKHYAYIGILKKNNCDFNWLIRVTSAASALLHSGMKYPIKEWCLVTQHKMRDKASVEEKEEALVKNGGF